MDSKQLQELQIVINTQRTIIDRLLKKYEEISEKATMLSVSIASEKKDADTLLHSLENLSVTELEQINNMFPKEMSFFQSEDDKIIEFKDWNSFIRECLTYCEKNGIDPYMPYEAILTEEDLKFLKETSYEAQYRWDKWDYIWVVIASALAVLTDFFFVNTPKSSPITQYLKTLPEKLPPQWRKWLEDLGDSSTTLGKKAKVPYDTHTFGPYHRVDLGHDPVLGFIFGVIEIMKGNQNNPPAKNLLEALTRQFLHLLSDVADGPGLPVPFASAFKFLKFGSFKINGQEKNISQLVDWMYSNGYDLRHFLTMNITTASIEIILRLYIMIRHYFEKEDKIFLIAKNPKYRAMLLTAHAMVAAINIGKVVITKNILSLNYAECIALIRYLLPSLKYWLFGRHKLKMEHLEKITDRDWDELVISSYELLMKIKFNNTEPIKI